MSYDDDARQKCTKSSHASQLKYSVISLKIPRKERADATPIANVKVELTIK